MPAAATRDRIQNRAREEFCPARSGFFDSVFSAAIAINAARTGSAGVEWVAGAGARSPLASADRGGLA
jgi:hypothetical protein